MSDDVEIFVHLKLPKNYYEVVAGLVRIYNFENFDDYVSDTIKENIEMLLDGEEVLDDCVHNKLTGKDSPYVKRLKETYRPINAGLQKMIEEEKSKNVSR